MLFSELAATSAAVGATRSRKRKAELLGAALRQLGPGEIEPGVAFLSGELRQRRTGVGWATLRELPPPAPAPELGVAEVDAAFARIAGAGGRRLAGGAARGGHGPVRAARPRPSRPSCAGWWPATCARARWPA